MNYYIWIAGKEHGPYTLEQVKEAVLEGTVTIQQTARRADSHDWVPLGSIVELPPETGAPALVEPALAAPVGPAREDVKDYLGHIRENSCYGVLRGIIEVFAALFMVAAVLAIGLGTFQLIQQQIAIGLYEVGGGIAALILIIGLRQSALLLIDIADTLLNEHAKGWRG